MTDFKENSEYKYISDLYRQLSDLKEGDPYVLKMPQYLFLHELETGNSEDAKKLRRIREQRSVYTNYLNPFIKRFISLIFKNPINYDLAKEQIFTGENDAEFNDIDGYGNSLETFIKTKIAPDYFLYGKAAVYVDSFQADTQSRLDEIQQGVRPFMETWCPLSLIDWQYSAVDSTLNGLDFAVRRYKTILPRETAKTEERIVDAFKHIYLDPVSGYYVIENEQDGVSEFIEPDPSLEFLPLAVIQTDSWLKEGSQKAIQLYNLESVLDNILLFQAHQRLFAIGNFTEASGKFAAGEGNLVILRGDGSITSIEPVNATSLKERISEIKASMFQLVFHNTRSASSDSKAVESADTMREAKEEFRSIAQSAAQDLEQVVNQALWMYAKFKGLDIEPDKFVSIDTNIADDDINDFAIWMNTFGDRIRRYPAWQKAVDKKAAQLMNLAESDEIMKEIDAGEVQQDDPISKIFKLGSDDNQETEVTDAANS